MVGRLANESERYREIRDRIQDAERALRDQREEVAALRRQLPLDTAFDDITLEEAVDGERRELPLSLLFRDPDKPLILMHFMYGKKQARPCPMCSAWADGYNGIVKHLEQKVNFAVLVAGDVGVFSAYARERGWNALRILSAANTTIKRDLGFESDDGEQHPGVSVFALVDGEVRHFYSQTAFYESHEFRAMDLLSPIWHFLDLTPTGRGDFFPAKNYS